MSISLSMDVEPADTAEPALTLAAGEGADRAIGQFRSTLILGMAAGLMAIGAVMSFSAIASLDRPLVTWPLLKCGAVRQLAFVVAALLTMLITARIPYRVWFAGKGWLALAALTLSVVGLGLVFVPHLGVVLNGARRWVQIPGTHFQFQPSELVKAALPVFLASWLVLRVDPRRFWRGLLPLVAIVGVCVGGVGKEDFGTAALLAAVAGGMLLMARVKWLHLVLLVLPTVPAFGYMIWSRPHRVGRLLAFLDPWSDPQGRGYQVIQSLCSIASGSWWGRGLGGGFVKGYLPQAQNDFIFAVICEEMGMIGAIVVIGLFAALMWQCVMVIRHCRDPVGRLLTLGIALTVGLQAAMNIAVVTASVPPKGISLPLVSAGGSGTITLGALVGVLANIARHTGTELEVRSEKGDAEVEN